MTAINIRKAMPEDFDAILKLNADSVQFLSPLTLQRLEHLDQQAAYHHVACVGKSIAAFLLAFREGAEYESPNYLWFAARYPVFLYIDRIVVSREAQGMRVGTQLYKDLFAYAKQENMQTVTCEFDVCPPNETSKRFHAKFGFQEVGQQDLVGGNKKVSLQALMLEH